MATLKKVPTWRDIAFDVLRVLLLVCGLVYGVIGEYAHGTWFLVVYLVDQGRP